MIQPGHGVTANMLVLGTSDSGFESQCPDKRQKARPCGARFLYAICIDKLPYGIIISMIEGMGFPQNNVDQNKPAVEKTTYPAGTFDVKNERPRDSMSYEGLFEQAMEIDADRETYYDFSEKVGEALARGTISEEQEKFLLNRLHKRILQTHPDEGKLAA